MNAQGEIFSFLRDAGWGVASLTPLKADFSTRQFARLERTEGEPRRAILMQAGPDQKTPEFLVIADLLKRCGLSVPEIFAAHVTPREAGVRRSAEAGHMTHASRGHATLDSRFRGNDTKEQYDLVLMEDFGDVTFGALMDTGHEPLLLYRRAVDVIVRLHQTFDREWIGHITKPDSGFAPAARPGMTPIYNDLPVFNATAFTAQAELFLDSFFPYARKRGVNDKERAAFSAAWLDVLAPLDAVAQTLMLRDFMPDNLMDLPERKDWRSVGLLDFQDGGIGPVAYDIASLCECVRRDTSPELLGEIVDYYHGQNPVLPLDELRRACRVLAAQRHTRVLGIMARLADKHGQRDKLAHVPRIWDCLEKLLQDEALAPVREWFSWNFSS